MSNEEGEEFDKISSLLSDLQVNTANPDSREEILVHSNDLPFQTAADLEQELARFRNDWKNEMSGNVNVTDNEPRKSTQVSKNIAVYHEFPTRRRPVSETNDEPESIDNNDCDYDQPMNNEDKAKYLFNKGVLLEQQNRHFEAIQFYRMAMQIDPDIEFKSCCSTESKNNQPTTETDVVITVDSNDDDDEEDKIEKEKTLYEQFQAVTLEENSFCTKRSPQDAMHFSDMPIEVVMLIMKWVVSDQLDIRSLENLSRVCKGFYVCARDPEIWKLACAKQWGRENISNKFYNGWREMYLTRPRINFDGAYISKTSYARAGEQGLDNFYSPWHLVEYYRYFRFFPDGTVIFLTCPEEPKNTVLKLKAPAISGDQNILKGTWKFNETLICMHFKKKRLSKKQNKFSRKQNTLKVDNVDREETFRIELLIDLESKKSSTTLRWSDYEIDIIYKEMNKKSHTKLDLNKVDFPHLYFSRVKSYMKEANSPLG